MVCLFFVQGAAFSADYCTFDAGRFTPDRPEIVKGDSGVIVPAMAAMWDLQQICCNQKNLQLGQEL